MYSINLNLSCSLLFLIIAIFAVLIPILTMSNIYTAISIGIALAFGPFIASFTLFLEWRKERIR